MSVLASSSDLSGQIDRTVNSSIEQNPDNYVLERANSNIRGYLDSEMHSGQRSSDTSGMVKLFSSKSIRQNSETMNHIDLKKVAPPVISSVSDKASTRQERTLIPITEWEGYVESVNGNQFSVRMVNVRSRSTLPVDQATFHRDDVSKYDRELLKEGAIVRWIIGREHLPAGQVRNVSELYFRRLPAHSKEDYKRAYESACALLEGIIWDNEAES